MLSNVRELIVFIVDLTVGGILWINEPISQGLATTKPVLYKPNK